MWLKPGSKATYLNRQLKQTAMISSRINIVIAVHFTGCVKMTNPSIYAGDYEESIEYGL